jgi:hypothetical protein
MMLAIWLPSLVSPGRYIDGTMPDRPNLADERFGPFGGLVGEKFVNGWK